MSRVKTTLYDRGKSEKKQEKRRRKKEEYERKKNIYHALLNCRHL